MPDKNPNKNFNYFAKRIGLFSKAVLYAVAHRTAITALDILSGDRKTLGKILDEMNDIPDISQYYNQFKDADVKSLKTVLWRLQNKGLITKNGNKLSLTKDGGKLLDQIKKNSSEKVWDKKWRMVFFDIPEKIANKRAWLRSRLKEGDFRMIQKSVFLGKYPLDQEFFQEIIDQKLKKYVRIMTIGEIDDDEILWA